MNIAAMMAQAKKMQAEIEKKQKELADKEFVIEKQGVKITLLGNRRIKNINVNEVLIDPDDKELLEDLITIAINEGQDLIDQEEEKLKPAMPSGMPF